MNYYYRTNRNWSPFWNLLDATQGFRDEARWTPSAEVDEEEGHYLLSMEIPGVAREKLKVEFHEDRLLISGERREEKFQRSFSLPQGIDADKVEAQYQDGVLQVYIPKVEAAKPREIKIGGVANPTTEGTRPGFFSRLIGSSNESKSDQVA